MTSPRLATQATKRSRADRLLAAALGALAFLLGCYELFDPDIWWHLRSGQWILQHGRVPSLDMFSFASADRTWVDLHWGFQVALALAHKLAGVAGMILMASAAGCAAFLIAMTARLPGWPRWAAALCWLPALALMGTRFDPRPEVFSLLYLACFLAVLVRVERHPTLAWCLPLVQVLWVNTHGLFALGPIVLGCYLVERTTRALIGPGRPDDGQVRSRRALWRHLIPVSAAVAIACLLNPYGMRGAMFPLELFPKISDPANLYKTYIDEFTSLSEVMHDQMGGMAGTHPHVRTQMFLLMLLPWSFVLPAAWEKWRSAFGQSEQVGAVGTLFWACGFVVACVVVLAAVLGVPLPGTARWLIGVSRAVPAIMVIIGGVAALSLAARSRVASATMVVGSAALAAWTAWLCAYLFDEGGTPYGVSALVLGYACAVLGALSIGLVIHVGGSIFRLLLLATFTYLSFQAIRNINLFGLVAGAVLAWNVSEWIARLGVGRPQWVRAWVAPGLVTGLVTLWAFGVFTDRYYALMGDITHFGLRERPLTFGHAAARFAGRPGLPPRALVFDLGQTGVYVYHNGPDRKVFMDARLEVPSRSTFQTYVRIEEWLNHGDPRWDVAIARLGDPLVLISHDGWAEAEAALLSHPRWRCIYFDEIASVFVTRTGRNSVPTLADHDFMAAQFAGDTKAPSSVDLKAAAAEATALLGLSHALRKRPGDPWRRRIPILICASDLTRSVLSGDRVNPAAWWRQLGLIQWETTPDLTRPPPRPSDAWDPAIGLSWARATFCFRQALAARPDDTPTLRSLAECFAVRGMSDARAETESALNHKNSSVYPLTLGKQSTASADLSWSAADQLAVTHLHLGEPDSARSVWNDATVAPSPALRLTRMAEAELAALDARAAAAHCQTALRLDPTLGEAWYVLAMANLDSGQARVAVDACREGMKRELTPAQHEALAGVERLLTQRDRLSRND
jgi:tetratricopeptide (TPR) repeat protein